jgi:ribose transport system substrate-binding protein
MRLPGRRWLSSAAVIAASAVLAACSSSSSSSTTSSAATGSSATASSGSTAAAGVAKAEQMVAQLEAATSTYPVPTASVSGVSRFKGRTVYYIPLDAHIPGFVVAAQAMQAALTRAGLNFQECDGQGTPSTIASCVSHAAGAGAVGIILDAIPYGMAENALNAATAKGVPVIIADQYAPAGTANTNLVTYVPGVVDQPSQIAWWLIAASGGKANAIIGEETDSPSTIAYVQNALPIFKQYCAGCAIEVKQITVTETSPQLQAAVSSNIATDPGVQYYYTEFEDSLQPTLAGIQQAGKSASIGVATATGTVDSLGLLKNGQDVKAVVAIDSPYEAWALTDEILRMMTKSGPVTETIPSRLFTSENIGSIQVTTAAQASGVWFGDNSYQAEFAQLWGAG